MDRKIKNLKMMIKSYQSSGKFGVKRMKKRETFN